MTRALHWQIREILPRLSDKELRLLIALNSRTNEDDRCWPSCETQMEDTGLSKPTVIKTRNQLVAMGAVIIVPFDQRRGEEKKLPTRQYVYELTGSITIESKTYVYFQKSSVSPEPETFAPPKVNVGLPLKVNIPLKVNPALPEVNTGSTEVNKESLDHKRAREDEANREIVALHETYFSGGVNLAGFAALKDALQDYPREWVIDALTVAKARRAQNASYITSMLQERKNRDAQLLRVAGGTPAPAADPAPSTIVNPQEKKAPQVAAPILMDSETLRIHMEKALGRKLNVKPASS